MTYDYLIVGAGFAGSVCAQRLAEVGNTVLLIDQRDHIGGNAFDKLNEQGVLIHPYGPHIFHTNSKRIFQYLSRFTNWRFYEHRALASVNGELYPFPINRTTINKLYKLNLAEEEVQNFFENAREPRVKISTSEDVVLNSVGRDLCDKFFRGYTFKQWGLDLADLSAGVAARIPTRTSNDDRYFDDAYQFMPVHGYSPLFNSMLDNKNIEVQLEEDFFNVRYKLKYKNLIYTGPIDSFYNYQFGKLPYRSIRFEHQYLESTSCYQTAAQINYPNDFEFTRITEFKYITGQNHSGTAIVREYPTSEGHPYYPIPTKDNNVTFKKYEHIANSEKNVFFIGRLAQYRYYNMDQIVGAALSLCDKLEG